MMKLFERQFNYNLKNQSRIKHHGRRKRARDYAEFKDSCETRGWEAVIKQCRHKRSSNRHFERKGARCQAYVMCLRFTKRFIIRPTEPFATVDGMTFFPQTGSQ